jgi:hypothetical protein
MYGSFIHLFKWKFTMKKILFFSALLAACCAFAAVSLNKPAPKVAEEALMPYSIEDEFHDPEWMANDKYLEQEKVKGKATFAKLLEQFPKGTLPYSLTTSVLRIDVDTMAYSKYRNREKIVLPREFRTFFPNLVEEGKFSRMPPPPPEPFLAFEADGKHVLIYLTERYSKTYMVATFDDKGKFISERHFAGVSLNGMTAATLDEHLNLTRLEYKILWDKPTDKNGYKNCKITELKLEKTTVESLIKKDSQKEIKTEKPIAERAIP